MRPPLLYRTRIVRQIVGKVGVGFREGQCRGACDAASRLLVFGKFRADIEEALTSQGQADIPGNGTVPTVIGEAVARKVFAKSGSQLYSRRVITELEVEHA